ncbi:aryl-alcohol dehydrogenase [Mycena crocata]|nr:aryl-alcohol dehydrogenase [Mycena crocata]
MHYVRLGNSGLKVSQLILGCMSYKDPEWCGNWSLPEEEALKHIKAAYDAGINTFDTADMYFNGLSEEILERAIKTHKLPRDEIVVMTKLTLVAARDTKSVVYGVDPDALDYIRQPVWAQSQVLVVRSRFLFFVRGSMKNSWPRNNFPHANDHRPLGHRFDPDTPISETMQALHDVVKAGYVHYIGMSSCYAWQWAYLHAMQNYAINNHLTPFISMQNQYSLVYREEREMFPTLKHFGVDSLPFSPLARGALSRSITEASKHGDTGMAQPGQLTQSDGSREIVTRMDVYMA